MTQRLTDIGAYLRAIVELKADGETAAAIARMFRIADDAPRSPPPPNAPSEGAKRPPPPTPQTPSSVVPPASAPLRDDDALPGDATTAGGVQVTFKGRQTAPARDEPLPVLAKDPPFERRPLPFEPLLRPQSVRSIVSAAVAGRRAGRRIDVPRAVSLLARLRPLEPFPWQIERAVPGAVVIALDRGPGMSQFARDAEDLVQRIAAVAGRDRTRVVRIWATPDVSAGREPKPFPLPAPGAVVVALSDLTIAPIGSARRTQEWALLARAVRGNGGKLIAFVPCPRQRWPQALVDELPIILWDRSTGPSRVRRALGAVRSLR